MEPSGARFNAAETTLQRWKVVQQSRTLLHCCRSSTLLCSSLLCTALHCCQSPTLLCTVVRAGGGGELVSARERGSSSALQRQTLHNPAQSREGGERTAQLCSWQVVQSLAEQSEPESWIGRWWEVGGGLPRSPASLHRSAHGHQSARHQTHHVFSEHIFLIHFPCTLLVLTFANSVFDIEPKCTIGWSRALTSWSRMFIC